MKYDYLIVGSGLFGCVFANLVQQHNKTCLILEKRNHPFGNCYTENISDINIHKYGPHIFHTSNKKIWNYINQFTKFNNYVNRPKVNFEDEIYSFPINLFTLYQLWGVKTPKEAEDTLKLVKHNIKNPQNLEEWILSQAGEEIYYKFIYGYTKKQWNTDPKNLPKSIIQRLPIRLNYNDNYFNDIYQGIPIGGYSKMMSNMIDNTEIVLDCDYFDKKDYWDSLAKAVIYCGPIDRYFNYCFGKLEYRSLSFDTQKLDVADFQGCAIMNYTSDKVEHTRIVEHKHFCTYDLPHTVITKEYPADFGSSNEPFYPINNTENNKIYKNYKKLSNKIKNTTFGGRLAQYKYFDMHQVVASAIHKFEELKNE
jgi:UDP-galactopyranose mutase